VVNFGGFVNEAEIMVGVSIEMYAMSSKSNEVTTLSKEFNKVLRIRYLILYATVPLL
jgi:cobalamin biosynthesis Mg chelatase CobN